MSRSLGVSSLTTFPPMRNSPLVMSSSPATIRSAVVLPQPDGPTSTMNSPSRTSRLRSLTAWKPFSYTLFTLSMSTVAIMPPYQGCRACWDDSGLPGRAPVPGRSAWARSSLHRPGGQAGDHELAEDEHQDADRDHRHHAGGEDGPVRDREDRAELRDAYRDGPVVVLAVEGERKQELGPAGGEAEDAGREDARQGHRQDDGPECPYLPGAVDPAGFLHLLGDAEHVVAQDPDGERQVERGVDEDQALIAVQPAEIAQQQVQRRDHGDRREDRDNQQRHHQGELPPHRHPAERVAGHGSDDQHQRRGDQRDDERVAEIDAEVFRAEGVTVVRGSDRVREVLRRAVSQVVRRLEAGGDQPVQRRPDEQDDEERRDVDAVDDPVPAGSLAIAH